MEPAESFPLHNDAETISSGSRPGLTWRVTATRPVTSP
jgi:hypothetical protein